MGKLNGLPIKFQPCASMSVSDLTVVTVLPAPLSMTLSGSPTIMKKARPGANGEIVGAVGLYSTQVLERYSKKRHFFLSYGPRSSTNTSFGVGLSSSNGTEKRA